LASVRAQLQDAQKQEKPLEQEVASLRVYKQRRVELQSQMDALQKQLATLQTIVPEEKQVDQFMLMIQSAAVSSGVSLRRMTAKPVGTKPYYFETAVRGGRRMGRIFRSWTSSRGWGGFRESSMWAT